MAIEHDENALRDEARKISGLETAALISIATFNYALCVWWLMGLPLTTVERTACAFMAITFGYGISGRPLWTVVHAVTKLPTHRCIYYGTFAGHAIGACLGALAGLYFSR